jgi:hypothetical protein
VGHWGGVALYASTGCPIVVKYGCFPSRACEYCRKIEF